MSDENFTRSHEGTKGGYTTATDILQYGVTNGEVRPRPDHWEPFAKVETKDGAAYTLSLDRENNYLCVENDDTTAAVTFSFVDLVYLARRYAPIDSLRQQSTTEGEQ